MEIKDKILEAINNNDVCLFMKGTPDAPQCGFSMAVSNVLKHLKVNFNSVNVLEDEICVKELKILVTGPLFHNYMLKVSLLVAAI